MLEQLRPRRAGRPDLGTATALVANTADLLQRSSCWTRASGPRPSWPGPAPPTRRGGDGGARRGRRLGPPWPAPAGGRARRAGGRPRRRDRHAAAAGRAGHPRQCPDDVRRTAAALARSPRRLSWLAPRRPARRVLRDLQHGRDPPHCDPRPDAALAYTTRALALADAGNDVKDRAMARFSAARVHLARGDADPAGRSPSRHCGRAGRPATGSVRPGACCCPRMRPLPPVTRPLPSSSPTGPSRSPGGCPGRTRRRERRSRWPEGWRSGRPARRPRRDRASPPPAREYDGPAERRSLEALAGELGCRRARRWAARPDRTPGSPECALSGR